MQKKWITRKKDEAVSPVIAVILMVAITVVLAAVLYVMVSGMMEETTTTPTGAFNFTQTASGTAPVTHKNYTGGLVSLSSDVDYTDVTMTVVAPTGSAASLGTDGALQSGTAVSPASDDFSVTYTDTNANNQLDGGDVIQVIYAQTGCQIKLVYIPSGGEIVSKTF